ncbi:hypothetical protein BBJ28_00027203, partial [Nothophytophthora sp. Chile5]
MVQRASASNEEGDEVAVETEAEEKTPSQTPLCHHAFPCVIIMQHTVHDLGLRPAAQLLLQLRPTMSSKRVKSTMTATMNSALRPAPLLPSRDDAEEREVGVITNPLDTVQEQQVAVEDAAAANTAAARLPTHREYIFDPQTRGSHNLLASEDLSAYATGPAAQTADEVVARDALRERYLSPVAFSVFDYRTRLFEQRSGRSVPAIRGIPIVRGPHETEAQHEALFQRWCEEIRNLPSLSTLQDSWSKDDVLIERRLRFDFAKLK